MRYHEIFENSDRDKRIQRMADALRDLQNSMAKKSNGAWRGLAVNGDSVEIEVRNWGSWEVPYGEDEEDNDHEVLSDDSYEYLNRCLEAVKQKYPELEVYSVGSEKRWLVFRASFKKGAEITPEGPADDKELVQTLTDLKQEMDAASPGGRWDPIDEFDKGIYLTNVKDWGAWSASGAMMPDTASALHDIMTRVKKANPKVNLTHRTNESNWLTFQAEVKAG